MKISFGILKKVTGQIPDMVREGGSIPVTLDFAEHTNKPVCMLPIGASDDAAHSQNEKFELSNMRNGIKVMSACLHDYVALRGA